MNTCYRRDTALPPTHFPVTGKYKMAEAEFTNCDLYRMVFKKSATLFKGVRFMLVSKNARHSESWTPVLEAADAVIVDDLPASPGTSTSKFN